MNSILGRPRNVSKPCANCPDRKRGLQQPAGRGGGRSRTRPQCAGLAKPLFLDRDKEEIRGYCDALGLIHEQSTSLPFAEEIVCRLHPLTHEFTVARLEQATPGVSREMLRRVLGAQKGKTVDVSVAARVPNGSRKGISPKRG